jgi:quercetin dioxygenase-like cupin family protein
MYRLQSSTSTGVEPLVGRLAAPSPNQGAVGRFFLGEHTHETHWLQRSCGMPALALVCLAANANDQAAPAPAASRYSYATNGVIDNVEGRQGAKWKLLLNESNLGGTELEAAELILRADTTVQSHQHGRVEIIYVLAGTYDHEVNGKLYRLTPGMIGIVRPGDSVRHRVPKGGDAKLLILWAPAGEAGVRLFDKSKGTTPAPVPEMQK